MEEQKAKKINIESIYEDLSVLKLVKYKLQNKRKDFSKNCEMLRLMKTDFVREIDYWDVLMYQMKEMSLDVHEERKWKKGIAYVLSNQIASKLKEKKSKQKLDELYKKCMCLYISMSVNYNFSDISMGKTNKKMSKALNDHIKSVTDTELFFQEFSHWKSKLKDIKNELEKKYELTAKKAKNFIKIINLMENMIVLQEEAVKRLNMINQQKHEAEKLKIQSELDQDNKKTLENFLMDVDMELSTTQKVENTFETLPSFNDLDFLNINREINSMMVEISEELGNYDIIFNNNPNANAPLNPTNNATMSFNTQDSTNIGFSLTGQASIPVNRYNSNTSFTANNFQNISSNAYQTNLSLPTTQTNFLNNIAPSNTQNKALQANSNPQNLLQISIRNSRYLSPTKSTFENEIIEAINPKQLFYDSNFQEMENALNPQKDSSSVDEKANNANSTIFSEKTNFDIVKNYLEKNANTDKIDVLKYYNYNKLHKFAYNVNFFYEDFEKTFSNIFRPIVPTEPSSDDKQFIESNIENLKNRYDKLLKEPELVKLFNFKFEKFTILQKLVTLWGLVSFGFAYGSVLAEVPNIFSFTKSIPYETEEILNFLNKTLEEFKVDSYISSFENIKYVGYDRLNNFCSKNIQGEKNKNVNFVKKNNEGFSKWIYNLDPPMLNNTNWDFFYNKKIFLMKKIKEESKLNNEDKETLKAKLREMLLKPTKEVLEDYPIVSAKDGENQADRRSGINLILSNPVFSLENKKMLFNAYKDFMRKLCEKVEGLYADTVSNLKKLPNAAAASLKENSNGSVINSTQNNNGIANNIKALPKTKGSNISNQFPSMHNSVTKSNTPQKDKETTLSLFSSGAILNKENLLAELNIITEDKNDIFSIQSTAAEKLNNTKPNNRQNIMEGVSFYSQSMIQKEWDNMRSLWYQNNTQFKPKFRKYYKAITANIITNPNMNSNSIPLLKNLNDNKA